MKNYDESVEINHNPNWPYIPDHPHKILIIGGSGSGKTNVLLNLIKNRQPDADKIYIYDKNPFESKYQLLIDRKEKVGIKELKNPKHLLITEKNNDAYEYFEDYNPTKKSVNSA